MSNYCNCKSDNPVSGKQPLESWEVSSKDEAGYSGQQLSSLKKQKGSMSVFVDFSKACQKITGFPGMMPT